MPQDSDHYMYFTVGLLKDSDALEALRKDALKYHFIDQPAKLIALRLTEYYELVAKGAIQQPLAGAALSAAPAQAAYVAPSQPMLREVKQDTMSHPAVTRNTTSHPAIPRPASWSNGPINLPNQGQKQERPSGALPSDEGTLSISKEVDQNAEEAANYWTIL